MIRELAKMSLEEVNEWQEARLSEIEDARSTGRISEEVAVSLLEWALDESLDYLTAASLGLIPFDQAMRKGGGSHER